MSRIRSVHPTLFTDEAFASISMSARLLLIGTWTEAHDDGVFPWKPLTLKMRLFPADNLNVEELLDELLSANVIKKFECEGKFYGAIRNFCLFQKPKKPNKSGVMDADIATYVRLDKQSAFASSQTVDVGDESVPNHSDTSSEPVPNQFGTNPEPVLQKSEIGQPMEDGGGNRNIIITPKRRKKAIVIDASVDEILSEVLSPPAIASLLNWRKEKKSPLTEMAAKRLVSEFKKFGDAERAVETMQMRGWTGFEAAWAINDAPNSFSGKSKGRVAAI